MQTVPPNPLSLSSKHGSRPAGTDTSALLELRINSSFVRLYHPTPQSMDSEAVVTAAMAPGPDFPSTTWICLLQGPLEEFVQYSREEASGWLIDLAHDICYPEHKRGWLDVWKEPHQQWCRVGSTDPLTASIHRYDFPAGTTVGLSKISQRMGKSKTDSTGNGNAMGDQVKVRDNSSCWVAQSAHTVANSHICPKRMGDYQARYIYRIFTGTHPDPGLSIYSDIFGICLNKIIDPLFDIYELGFRFVDTDKYECHVFAPAPKDGSTYSIFGLLSGSLAIAIPPLHGHTASPPCPESRHIPPAGLFRWHYLQCVVRKFGHKNYKELQNIDYFELPLPMEGDSDDEGTDSEADWPSKVWDLGRAAGLKLKENEERKRAVATWVESTSK